MVLSDNNGCFEVSTLFSLAQALLPYKPQFSSNHSPSSSFICYLPFYTYCTFITIRHYKIVNIRPVNNVYNMCYIYHTKTCVLNAETVCMHSLCCLFSFLSNNYWNAIKEEFRTTKLLIDLVSVPQLREGNSNIIILILILF